MLDRRWLVDLRVLGRPLLLDGLLAAGCVLAATTLTAEALVVFAPEAPRDAALATAALHGAVVGLRRLTLLPAAGVLLLTAGVHSLVLGVPVYMLGPAVLAVAYALGAALPRRPAAVVLGVLLACQVALVGLGPSFPGWDSLVLYAVLTSSAWLLGLVARRWQTMAAESARRAAELESARTELARLAVAAERVRIARELHDVVAHSMSVVAMHAGAARLAVGTDPEAERAALTVIERSSRGALAEMRRLVTVLRDVGPQSAERGPAPTLADLPALAAEVAAAGVTVEVRTHGDLHAVPDGVALAGYRIAQEALTNVVRHCGPGRARLEVAARPGELRLRVQDPGPSTARVPDPGGGHGIEGMRERVGLYDGTLCAGPTPAGGWAVEARIPHEAGDR